jgi:hypothetical protein
MSRLHIRLLAGAIVAFLVVGGLMIKCYIDRERTAVIERSDFATGVAKADVINRLGQPVQELSGAELARRAAHSCAPRAASMLGYSAVDSDGGPYIDIYFDDRDHVLCVEHGLVAL